jgi:hypothetical protein
VNAKELMEMGKKKPEMTIKLTAASLRELRLMYGAGAIGRLQLHQLLGLPVAPAAPQELPMPKESAETFLKELRETMEGKLGSRT